MQEAYVSGTHPPVALQGRDLLRQLRLDSLHYNRWKGKKQSEHGRQRRWEGVSE